MSVVGFASVRQRIWRGYDDPGLPAGMYVAHLAQAGDASGGTLRIVFEFKKEADPVSARFYNLEQFSAHQTGTAININAALTTQNFDRAGNDQIPAMEWVYELHENSRASVIAANFRELPQFPIFLGQISLDISDATLVIVETGNVDGSTLFATIQGYIWEPRSTQAPGGLRRPADSLFG